MTKEHFWTLDNATLTCFRTLYPRIKLGHLRYSGMQRRTMVTCITPGGNRSRSTAGNALGLRKMAHSPPPLSILLTNVQSLENKMDDLRASISFQRDIRDCNILCLSETWLTTSVPDTPVTPSDKFSVLRMDRTAEDSKTKGGGVCFMINKKWCGPRNISILSRSCSPHLEHLSIIHYPNTLMLPLSSRGTLTKPTSGRSCRTFGKPPTRGPNTLDHCYTQFKNAYNALLAFGKSDHATIFLTPEYKPNIQILQSKTVGGQNNPCCG